MKPLRAKRIGRVTRRSTTIRYPAHEGRPLPFALQCLPQMLDPTPRNPGCATTRTWGGEYARMLREYGLQSFLDGQGLDVNPRTWAVKIEGRTYWTDDAQYGLAFVRAAKESQGLNAELYVQSGDDNG